jgi:2-dehydro-3-deoxygalactonokinase
MTEFLSCDWGTSAFRLRLVATADLTVTAEEKSAVGIARTFAAWQQTNCSDADERVTFYRRVLQEHVQKLQDRLGRRLANIPVVVSGMASASIGLLPLPYGELPFPVSGAGLQTHFFPAAADFPHNLLLISGIRSADDVMRGEETQLIGCINEAAETTGERTYIFPGTHAKHIQVHNGRVIAFQTYMTGEFFDLLAHQSILQTSVSRASDAAELHLPAFQRGVAAATQYNVLHAAFRVRTNELFEKLTRPENFAFLSGVLIGTELQTLVATPDPTTNAKIYLASDGALKIYYAAALQALGLSERVHTLPDQWVAEAVVRGQFKIFNQWQATQ